MEDGRPRGHLPLSGWTVILFLLSFNPSSQFTSDVITTGQCHMKCASPQFAKEHNRILNDRRVVREPLLNETKFVYCKLGCLQVPQFDELKDESFLVGKMLRKEMDQMEKEAAERTAPPVLSGVEFLCVHENVANLTRVNITLQLITNTEFIRPLDYYIEVVTREGEKETVIQSIHTFSVLHGISLEEESGTEVQIRAIAIDGLGQVGQTVYSRWWRVDAVREAVDDTHVTMTLHTQLWHEERAAVVLNLTWPAYRIPLCSAQLTVTHVNSPDRHYEFHLDESRSLFVPHLRFGDEYSLILDSDPSFDQSSHLSQSLIVNTQECPSLVSDPSMCPPPPVSSLSYRWNGTDSFILSWDFDRSRTIRNSHHFLLQVTLHPKNGRVEEHGVCDGKKPLSKKPLPGETRSAHIRLPSSECAFSVEMVAVDARNRWSRSIKIDSWQAESESLEASAAGVGVEFALLWSVFVFLAVLGVGVSILVLRHQRRTSHKACDIERERNKKIMARIYEGETLSHRRYVPAPAVQDLFLPPIPSFNHISSETPRGVYRAGTGWSGGDRKGDCSNDISYVSSRLLTEDGGYAVCEVAEPASCQYNLSLFPLPQPERRMGDVPLYNAKDFMIGEILGKGRFGSVYAARNEESGTLVAMKVFVSPTDLQIELTNAMNLCLHVSSPRSSSFFPSLLGVCTHDEAANISSLLYEFCPGGDLRTLLLSLRESLPREGRVERTAKKVSNVLITLCRQTAEALLHLHSLSLVHRDVSARNVLLSLPWNSSIDQPHGQSTKLADLGLVSPIGREGHSRRLALPWQSPQVKTGAPFTLEDDVWSFGCLLMEVASLGGEPHPSFISHQSNLKSDTMTLPRNAPTSYNTGTLPHRSTVESMMGRVGHPKIDARLSDRLGPLMKGCLAMERSVRPTMQRVVEELSLLSPQRPKTQEPIYFYSQDSVFI